MKLSEVFQVLVLCIFLVTLKFANALTSEEITEVTDSCCSYGEDVVQTASSVKQCAEAAPPEDIDYDQLVTCLAALKGCCEQHFKQKDECSAGIKLAASRRCSVPKTDIGKTCCDECAVGTWTGESQGIEACGEPTEEGVSPATALRKHAYYQCCVEAANKPTTTERPTTTTKKVTTTAKPKEKCKPNSCDHICNDVTGKIICQCRDGYRLQGDKKTCKDINECAEASDDLCTAEDTVCHNVPGSFKCVPVRKRDVGNNCPAGFKKNLINQVCDDINECQLPRPPCPKYLCENTIGGFKCAGKPGKPASESAGVTETASTTARNDICPPGFRAGDDDECIDIDECREHSDDCQRLSQHCINTHGGFFCQDHVSKRCAPGFKVNTATGVCEDIDECEESSMVCQRNEVCVNMPGAYTCKSKIDTLPKLATKTCQEGTRLRPGASICEDIDECREGTHLCDQFQNCINTFGAHECRCKSGFELDSSGSCVDINECALKLDNCRPGSYCLNVLGSFTCTRRPPSTTTTPGYEYEYYDSDEDNSTVDNETNHEPPKRTNTKPTTTTSKPTTKPPPSPRYPNRPDFRRTTTISPSNPPQRTTTSPPKPPQRTTTSPSNPPRRTTTISPSKPESRTTDSPSDSPEDSPAIDSRTTTGIPPPPPLPPHPDELEPRTSTARNNPNRPGNRPEYGPPEPNHLPEAKPRSENPAGSPGTSRNPTRPEVILPSPKNPDVVENPGDPGLNTSEIPKDRWTNVIGRDGEKPGRPGAGVSPDTGFELDNLHCLFGYVRNERGECVDMDECSANRHICSNLEVCRNRPGGYVCDCMAGYHRDGSGWCVPAISTTQRTTSTTTAAPVRPPYAPSSRRDRPAYAPPTACELGFQYDLATGQCQDIDECLDVSRCDPQERCVNFAGGYRCECQNCQPRPDTPPYAEEVHPSPTPRGRSVITVGSQYGARGARYLRPSYTRLAQSGALLGTCPWGYRLTEQRMCEDIDECSSTAMECGPEQRCENFYGGYSCSCPAGHQLAGAQQCDDIDECQYGQPCPYNSKCVNTVGGFRCECGPGFRNSPTSDKSCVDIDECAETPSVCKQGCANTWGSYRCYCQKGYRTSSDNRTCVDIDECSEWDSSNGRGRGRLCAGQCVNEPGSYRCGCPSGYRLGHDQRTCVDINECENGEARCSAPNEVCQNTRGGFHCHRIACPQGYRLEAKHRCARIQRSCLISDWSCLQQPSAYTYNFITLVAHVYLPQGSVDLFTMHGPSWSDAAINFELRMIDVQAGLGVQPADLGCFDMRPSGNVCVISLLCSLSGPQSAELELLMTVRRGGEIAGSAAARLVVIVSQYDF